MNTEQLWESFIKSFPMYQSKNYGSFSFGNSEEMANELASLVKCGKKTATTSGYCFYELENERLPEVGDLNIILNGNEEAKCVIQTTKVYITPFHSVSEDHAYKEGEGDLSLAYWRRAHQAFFQEVLAEYNLPFTEELLVVCEEFNVIYQAKKQ